MFNENDLTLIDRYLLKQLSETERQHVEQRMEQDVDFRAEVLFKKSLLPMLEDAGYDSLKAELQALDDHVFGKKEATERTYTLAELLTMFGVVEVYESVIERAEMDMATVRRTTLFEVLQPLNGVEAFGKLYFELAKRTRTVLKLVIENSEEDEVLRRTVAIDTPTFEIDTSDWQPGRYYWKLTGKGQVVLRSFFVGKRWIPKELLG